MPDTRQSVLHTGLLHVTTIYLLSLLNCVTADARDFPLASCKSANGTIIQMSGTNTDHATMVGTVTAPDAMEYCDRDPGGETTANGGPKTVEACVAEYLKRENGAQYRAIANCPQHILESNAGRGMERFRLVRNDEGAFAWGSIRTGRTLGNSCGDGTPPLFEQFKILCPREASNIELP